MKYPIKLNKIPILEAVIELRYSSKLPAEAIFGVIYKNVKSIIDGEVKTLPIMQLPDAVRNSDPNLRYQSYYTIQNKNYNFNIGPRSIVLGYVGLYPGWNDLSKYYFEILESLKSEDVFDNVERIGLRYINFFEKPIFNSINVNLNIVGREILDESTNIKTEINDSGFKKILNIGNNVILNSNGKSRKGSVIDIDCIYNLDFNSERFYDEYKDIMNQAHLKEKEMFFNILGDELVKSLAPIYEE